MQGHIMDDILNQFLNKTNEQSKDFFLDVIPQESSEESPFTGTHVVLFFWWLLLNGLVIPRVIENVKSVTDLNSIKERGRTDLFRIMRESVGCQLHPNYLTDTGKSFAAKYYTPGGWAFYLKDLEQLYPDLADFSTIPDTQMQLNKILAMIDRRYSEFRLQVK